MIIALVRSFFVGGGLNRLAALTLFDRPNAHSGPIMPSSSTGALQRVGGFQETVNTKE
jgi:hypothetical protein